jgi:hypothetical protein
MTRPCKTVPYVIQSKLGPLATGERMNRLCDDMPYQNKTVPYVIQSIPGPLATLCMAQGWAQWRRAGHHWRRAGHNCTLWDYHWLQISCELPGVACPPPWLDTNTFWRPTNSPFFSFFAVFAPRQESRLSLVQTVRADMEAPEAHCSWILPATQP